MFYGRISKLNIENFCENKLLRMLENQIFCEHKLSLIHLKFAKLQIHSFKVINGS